MNKSKIVDVKTWKRYKQYLFFKDFDSPFFNVCTQLDVSELKNHCNKTKDSFLIRLLFETLTAANKTQEFKYRLKGDDVVEYNQIHTGITVLTKDKTFNFCYIDYNQDFDQFRNNANQRIEASKTNSDDFEPKEERIDLLHISSMPWTSFTSISHARNFKNKDSVPKLVFGKYFKDGDKWLLPFSVEVHHALVDGIHVGQFLEILQKQLNSIN